MAQNIQLTDRVRYFPTKTKADILPRLGAKFIATVIFNASDVSASEDIEFPRTFTDWQDGSLNYQKIVGFRDGVGAGYGLISDIDWNIFFNYGLNGYALNIMNKSYYVYYGEGNVNPETGLNSGFMLYDVYNVQSYPVITAGSSSKMYATISVDIYESTELINTATNYADIGQ